MLSINFHPMASIIESKGGDTMLLQDQLQAWHDENEYQQIINAIMNISEEERSYELIGWLGRSLNNVGKYEEALHWLYTISSQGKHDGVWHYRVGYAYVYLKRYEEAMQAFSTAQQLLPDDENIAHFINLCSGRIKHELQNNEIAEAARAAHRLNATANAAPFADFDFNQFWEDSQYARDDYVSAPPSASDIAQIERELGYKLPASYIHFMQQQNGGIPANTCFPTQLATSWSDDHIAITGIMGIGKDKSYSLGGDFGSQFMIEEWGYPDIGVVICDCPSAGHDVVMLDYRACGPDGEPEVIHVDQESDYEITFLAPTFESFIKGLVHEDEYDTSEEDKILDLEKVEKGEFSPLLAELCSHATEVSQLEQKIREIARQIVEEKGFFALHADDLSTLLYDIQFWLYTSSHPDTDREGYLQIYDQMIAFGKEFGTGGYAPGFITDWLDVRIQAGAIQENGSSLSLSEDALLALMERLRSF